MNGRVAALLAAMQVAVEQDDPSDHRKRWSTLEDFDTRGGNGVKAMILPRSDLWWMFERLKGESR